MLFVSSPNSEQLQDSLDILLSVKVTGIVNFDFVCIQLQQINFMSLMQIVQSSFTSVPNVQQVLQQHQSVHLAGRQPAHAAESNVSPKIQAYAQKEKGKTGQESSVFHPRKSVEDEGNSGQIKVGI